MFSFSILRQAREHCKTRLGRLTVPHRSPIETPHYVAITSRGAVPHISQDLMRQHTGVQGVYVALEDCEAALSSRRVRSS